MNTVSANEVWNLSDLHVIQTGCCNCYIGLRGLFVLVLTDCGLCQNVYRENIGEKTFLATTRDPLCPKVRI